MIKIIALRESGWLDRNADNGIWHLVCAAYGIDSKDFFLFDDLIDIPNVISGTIVVMDEQGETNLNDFTHPEDATYIFGRTHVNDLIEIPHDHSVVIPYPGNGTLFGVTAAAITFADRLRKE